MPRKAKKHKMKGTGTGRKLTQFQREMIIQTYALCGNKTHTAREVGCSVPSVYSVLKAAETDRSLQKARSRALESVAGQVHAKTVDILGSIGPTDLESGLIKVKNEDGTLKSVKAWGPSLMQKVTSAAILTDKLKVIAETKAALAQDAANGDPAALPMPDSVQGALKMLGEKVKRLRILDVQFADKHEDTVSKVQEVAHAASLHKNIEEADYEELDFDNPVRAEHEAAQ